MKISAEPRDLVRQAGNTAAQYFDAAVENIEKTFGKGSAHRYPEIIAALIAASASDFETSIRTKFFDEEIAPVLQDIANALDSQKNN